MKRLSVSKPGPGPFAARLGNKHETEKHVALWLCVDGPGLARFNLRLIASWSGAAMCSACLRDTMIAGPNAIRGSGPN